MTGVLAFAAGIVLVAAFLVVGLQLTGIALVIAWLAVSSAARALFRTFDLKRAMPRVRDAASGAVSWTSNHA